MAGFIEYGSDEEAVRRARRAARARPGGAAARDLPDAVADELDDIFGGDDVEELMAEFREQAARRKARLDAAGGAADVDLDVEDEDEDDDGAAAFASDDDEDELTLDDFGGDEEQFAGYRQNLESERAARRAERAAERRRRRQARARAATAAVEPAALERHMLRPEDDAARAADVPERLLGSRLPPACGRVASGELRADAAEVAEEIARAAAWVADRLFGPRVAYSRAKRILERGVMELDPGTVAAVSGVVGEEQEQEEKEKDGGEGEGNGDGGDGDGDGKKKRAASSSSSFNFSLVGDLTPADLSRLGGRRALSLRRRTSGGNAWRQDPQAQRRLLSAVAAALRGLWVERLEVPAMALHAPGTAVFDPTSVASSSSGASSSASSSSSPPSLVLASAKPALGELLAMREADAPFPATQGEAARRLAAGLPPFPEGTL